MKTQSKILILLLLTLATFVISSLFFQYLGSKQKKIFLTSQKEALSSFTSYVLKDKSEKYLQSIRDYAIWDEMTNFVKNRNTIWGEQNLNRFLPFYKASCVWIFDEQKKTVYSVCDSVSKFINQFPVDTIHFNKIFNRNNECDFFVYRNHEYIEILGSTIHPSSDVKRVTPVKGYMFLAIVWNNSFLEQLQISTQTDITFENKSKTLDTLQNENKTIYTHNLHDWNKKVIGNLYFAKDNQHISEWNDTNIIRSYIIIISSIALLILFSIVFYRWITLPLSKISKALSTNDVQPIKKLTKVKSEFGEIAILVEQSFQQQQILHEQKEELVVIASQLQTANEYIKESEQQLHYIFEFLPDPVLVIDKDGVVIAWNRAMVELTKVPREDIIGKGNYEYAIPFYGERRPILIDMVLSPIDEFSSHYTKVSRKGVVLYGESYIKKLGKDEMYLSGTVAPLYNSKNEITGAIEIIIDLTEKKNIEETIKFAYQQLSQQTAQINQHKEELLRHNELLQQQKEEILSQKDALIQQSDYINIQNQQIVEQNEILRKQNFEIKDSILYAKNIQTALLPPDEMLKDVFPDNFVLYKPRDIVSGDFYWVANVLTKNGNTLNILAVGDCTGHGVPGAFMSLLGISFLNEIIRELGSKQDYIHAHSIINELRKLVKQSLRQTGKDGETNDGMDMLICIFDFNLMKMQFAGAYRPLYIIRKNIAEENYDLIEYKGDSMPVGIHLVERESFTNYEIDIHRNDRIYLSSDGFEDQLGGEKGKKFLSKYFKQLLLSVQSKSMDEQKAELNQTLENWINTVNVQNRKYFQLDDVLVIGVRI